MLTVDLYCFHIEALHSDEEIEKLIQHIKEKGMKVGMAIKPKTPSTLLYPFIEKIDMALVMVSPPNELVLVLVCVLMVDC
jgi:ribulose-phosphate 3-epimerase